MKKRAYFDEFVGRGWPSPSELQHYFLTADGRKLAFGSDNDSWGLTAEGVDGTEDLPTGAGRVDVHLMTIGNLNHGVLLQYFKMGNKVGPNLFSYADLSRLYERERTLHGDILPIGLCVPFEAAWQAVKEFIERDGALPQSITWIAADDLPKNVFPEQ